MKKTLSAAGLIAVLAILVLPAALARGASPGPMRFTMSAYRSGDTAIYKLRLWNTSPFPLPTGTSVSVTTCAYGQQVPFKLAHRTRHLGNGERLDASAGGRVLVWTIPNVRGSGFGASRLTLAFRLPRFKLGPLFCADAVARSANGQRVYVQKRVKW